MPIPSLSELLRAYERSLIAKVQLEEFAMWGESTTVHFKAAIAAHAEAEHLYLAALRAARRRAEGDDGSSSTPAL